MIVEPSSVNLFLAHGPFVSVKRKSETDMNHSKKELQYSSSPYNIFFLSISGGTSFGTGARLCAENFELEIYII